MLKVLLSYMYFHIILQDNRANFNKFGTKLTWAKGIQVGKLKIYALLQGGWLQISDYILKSSLELQNKFKFNVPQMMG